MASGRNAPTAKGQMRREEAAKRWRPDLNSPRTARRAGHHAGGGFVAGDGFLDRIPVDLAAGAHGDVAEVADGVGADGGVDVARGGAAVADAFDKIGGRLEPRPSTRRWVATERIRTGACVSSRSHGDSHVPVPSWQGLIGFDEASWKQKSGNAHPSRRQD